MALNLKKNQVSRTKTTKTTTRRKRKKKWGGKNQSVTIARRMEKIKKEKLTFTSKQSLKQFVKNTNLICLEKKKKEKKKGWKKKPAILLCVTNELITKVYLNSI